MSLRAGIVSAWLLGFCVLADRGLAGEAPKEAGRLTLDNGRIAAEFQGGGLVRLRDVALDRAVELFGEQASITVDGTRLDTAALKLAAVNQRPGSLEFTYDAGPRRLRVVYELKPGWRFLSKQIFLDLPAGSAVKVDAVDALVAELQSPVFEEHRLGGGSRGVLLRMAKQAAAKPQPAGFGLFLVLQNPMMKWKREGKQISAGYLPEMEWKAQYGPLASDRACLGTYAPGGVRFPAGMVPEWKYVPEPEKAAEGQPMLDWAEIDAVARCAAAFVLAPPKKSVKIHVGWCENDYQIDVGTREGRTEYRRIIDRAAAVGCDYLLFGPSNHTVSSLGENTDAWGWENILWLGLGQKIRKGRWDPSKDPIPSTVQEMIDYAGSKKVRLVAYVYPSLVFKQDPAWTHWVGDKAGGYLGCDTGVRSFQDWLVDKLVSFRQQTGAGGFSFDYWWIAYDNATSKYAQWYGCRRVLESLRQRMPDVVIDGRQQYHWFGPWTWLAGSYPHPMGTDEQPGSYENFPDLHFDRVSADRQRYAAWWYRVEQFCPVEILPGFMTHQTQRVDAQGVMRRDRFRPKDWDYLGWKYSVLSSIGTAPLMHVVNMLPARDEDEFKAFSREDQAWLRKWLAWTDEHFEVLRHVRPILGQPMLGRVDGTAAIERDRGFVFLFNPNYRRLEAEFTLDGSIGLTQGRRFLIRELYPQESRLLGKPQSGPWQYGDRVRLSIKGPQAMVLEIAPMPQLPRPMLFGVTGRADLDGDRLRLTGVRGEVGTRADVVVLLPADSRIGSLEVNGRAIKPFAQKGTVLTATIRFAGTPFEHCQQIGSYDRSFAGKLFRSQFTVPEHVFTQLADRKKAWPVPYDEDDRRATWLAPERLLLFVQIADADDKMAVAMTIDGKPVEIKPAYGAIYPDARERTFLGFYADVSRLTPDTQHEVELTLPALRPGQFQGLFFENVEAELTAFPGAKP